MAALNEKQLLQDDDIFKTVERRQERERLSQFTFTIAITTKKALTIPYKKTDSLAGLKNKMLEPPKQKSKTKK